MAHHLVTHEGVDAPHDVEDRLVRYLANEQAYHVDLLQLLRKLGAGRMTPALQTQIDELRCRREHLSRDRDELLRGAASHGSGTLSELIQLCDGRSQPVLHAQVQSVRSLIIQTRLAAEQMGRRLTLMHDCLEEILTGKPPVKSMSYDRAGRLNSSPSSRSLLTRRA